MERALDPVVLALALGQHASLPSVEEISERIAEAELALLLAKPSGDPALIGAGWYLHGIASSKYALQTYGQARQLAAFKVAAHIFDLATKGPDLSSTDKLKYCFASQVAYLRSELDPNALAIYNEQLSGRLPEVSLLGEFPNVALCCAVAFLGFDVGYVFQTTGNLQRQSRELTERWQLNDFSVLPQGAAAAVSQAVRNLMIYLLYGNRERLEQAREALLAAIRAEASAEDLLSRWVSAHLLNLTDDLDNSSVGFN